VVKDKFNEIDFFYVLGDILNSTIILLVSGEVRAMINISFLILLLLLNKYNIRSL
jgi:hypothetical protein